MVGIFGKLIEISFFILAILIDIVILWELIILKGIFNFFFEGKVIVNCLLLGFGKIISLFLMIFL